MRVVMFKGHSQYAGTRLFVDHAAEAFRRRGADVDLVDVAVPTAEQVAALIDEAVARGPADLIFTINMFGEAHHRGQSLAALFGARHVVWHVDYILSQQPRLETTPAETALLMVDPTQVDALRSFYGSDRYAHIGFMPHAAVGEAAPDDADPEAFAAARPIPLLWCGGLVRPGQVPWADAPVDTRKLFDETLDLALSVEWMPAHEAFDHVLTSRGLDIADPQNLGARYAAVHIDTQVRLTRRYAFVKALAKTGLPVHICGAGWEKDLYRFKNATVHGPVDMDVAAGMMRQARIVLNTNGNFGGGSHERPFSALLAGAAPFTDTSRYYEQIFEDGRDAAFYRWQALGEGMARLQALAADPAAAFEIVRNGKPKVLAGHTFDARVDRILEAAGLSEALPKAA